MLLYINQFNIVNFFVYFFKKEGRRIMDSRVLVTGKYEKGNYILYREDNTIFKRIKPYKRIRIEGKTTDWIPIYVRNGKYRTLICRKVDKERNIVEEFPLIHNKRGLWALTKKAAENGIFHAYREPKTELEKLLDSMQISLKNLQYCNKIDTVLKVTNPNSKLYDKYCKYHVETDCKIENIGNTFGEHHIFQNIHVYGGSFVIYYRTGMYSDKTEYKRIEQVFYSHKVNMKQLISFIKENF